MIRTNENSRYVSVTFSPNFPCPECQFLTVSYRAPHPSRAPKQASRHGDASVAEFNFHPEELFVSLHVLLPWKKVLFGETDEKCNGNDRKKVGAKPAANFASFPWPETDEPGEEKCHWWRCWTIFNDAAKLMHLIRIKDHNKLWGSTGSSRKGFISKQ